MSTLPQLRLMLDDQFLLEFKRKTEAHKQMPGAT